KILLLYLSLTILSVCWALFWLKKRKLLDFIQFQQKSLSQDLIYEMLSSISELKINQFDKIKRSQWEEIQQKLFRTNSKILKIDQIQLSGYEFLSQLKNILATFLGAFYVIK